MPVIHRRIYRCRKAQPAQCVPESRHCSYTGVYMRSLCTHAYVSQRERMRDASKKVSPLFSDAFASLLTHFPNTSRVTRYPLPIISRFNITVLIFTSHFISASRDCHFKHVLCFKVPTVALILLTYRVITSLWAIRVDARTGAFDIYHLITRKHADATRRDATRRDATIPHADPSRRKLLRVSRPLLRQWMFLLLSSNFEGYCKLARANPNARFIGQFRRNVIRKIVCV